MGHQSRLGTASSSSQKTVKGLKLCLHPSWASAATVGLLYRTASLSPLLPHLWEGPDETPPGTWDCTTSGYVELDSFQCSSFMPLKLVLGDSWAACQLQQNSLLSVSLSLSTTLPQRHGAESLSLRYRRRTRRQSAAQTRAWLWASINPPGWGRAAILLPAVKGVSDQVFSGSSPAAPHPLPSSSELLHHSLNMHQPKHSDLAGQNAERTVMFSTSFTYWHHHRLHCPTLVQLQYKRSHNIPWCSSAPFS